MKRGSQPNTAQTSQRTNNSPWRACLLVWLLVAAIPSQSILFSPAAGQVRLAESQRQWEEESDEGESSSEEHAGQPIALSVGRDRRLQLAPRQRQVALVNRFLRKHTGELRASLARPAELSGRNGSGGPLRC